MKIGPGNRDGRVSCCTVDPLARWSLTSQPLLVPRPTENPLAGAIAGSSAESGGEVCTAGGVEQVWLREHHSATQEMGVVVDEGGHYECATEIDDAR